MPSIALKRDVLHKKIGQIMSKLLIFASLLIKLIKHGIIHRPIFFLSLQRMRSLTSFAFSLVSSWMRS